MSSFFPMVIENVNGQERAMSIDARLLQDRIIVIDGGVDANLSKIVNAQLLYLDSISSDDITVYLNSPGGSVSAGLSIQDTMNMCRSDISIIGSGILASMGCYLLSQGTPGKRFVTKHAQIMAHQVSSGTQGHVEDQIASVRQSEKLNDILSKEIAAASGKPLKTYMKDVNRDFWLTAEEALLYGTKGLCDGIIDGTRDEDGELVIKGRDHFNKKGVTKVNDKTKTTQS